MEAGPNVLRAGASDTEPKFGRLANADSESCNCLREGVP